MSFIEDSSGDLKEYERAVDIIESQSEALVKKSESYSEIMTDGSMIHRLYEEGFFDTPFPEPVAATRKDIANLVADLVLAEIMSSSTIESLYQFIDALKSYRKALDKTIQKPLFGRVPSLSELGATLSLERQHANEMIAESEILLERAEKAGTDLVEAEENVPVYFSGPSNLN